MYVNELLSEAIKIQPLNVEDDLAVAKYPTSGSFIDVSDFERFAFLIQAGALDSATTCQVEQAKTINGSPKVVTGAVVVIPADGDDKWYLIEVQTNELDSNDGYRYVTLDVTGPAAGDDYGAITFFGINPGYRPVTQGADCGEVVTLVG
jgi:hypothetical protein